MKAPICCHQPMRLINSATEISLSGASWLVYVFQCGKCGEVKKKEDKE